MIKLVNVFKEYPNFTALNDISLEIHKGEFVTLVGHSGSGKSTILNIIGLIDIPTKGQIILNEENITKKSENEKASIRNKMIGFVFQDFYLEPFYSVFKNVELPLIILGMPPKERYKRVCEVLEIVGMNSKAKNNASTLSGGEKQRVAIARAIVNNPEIILADEPTGNLDSKNSSMVMDFFKSLKKQGKTILMVTHNLEEAELSDRKMVIKDGKFL